MSTARRRTVAHMNKMLATATAVACSRPDVQTVTITPLPNTPASTDATPPPPPPTQTTSHLTPPPPPTDTAGYLVVDMLPAPARCLGVANAARATAKFKRESGALLLDVSLSLPSLNGVGQVTFTGTPPSAWSAQVVSSTARSGGTTGAARLKPNGSNAGVSFEISCGAQGIGTLAVDVTFASPPTEQTPVTLNLHDY